MRAASADKGSSVDIGGTAMTFAEFMSVVSQLGELAVGNKVCVVSPEALVANFLQLDQVVTLEKFGNQATILSGQLASLAEWVKIYAVIECFETDQKIAGQFHAGYRQVQALGQQYVNG